MENKIQPIILESEEPTPATSETFKETVLWRLQQLCVLKIPLITVGTILVLLPLALSEHKETRCGYGVLVMAILWLTEVIPISATALLPVFIFPMCSVLPAKEVSKAYINDLSMLFLGGLILAAAVEEWNLHRRLAIAVLRVFGTDPRLVLLGIMLPTWFLSMWISNTAMSSMMIPIANAVVRQIEYVCKDEMHTTTSESAAGQATLGTGPTSPHCPSPGQSRQHVPARNERDRERLGTQPSKLSKAVALCVGYSSSIGGIATLIGTPPNVVFKGQADDLFNAFYEQNGLEPEGSGVTFAMWTAMALPLSFLLLVSAWLLLMLAFLRHFFFQKISPEQKKSIKLVIIQEWDKLGDVRMAEVIVLVMFFLLAILWVSRDPKEAPGWSVIFTKGYVSDSTAVILIVFSLFILPAEMPETVFYQKVDGSVLLNPLTQSKVNTRGAHPPKYYYQPLLKWEQVQKRVPWGVILLLGGGFALAKACLESGLSKWLGDQLTALTSLDKWVLNVVLTTAVAFATEVTSNTATATLLMPIAAQIAMSMKINPLYLMSSCALATSFAFMLPAATPPNAIVFSYGGVRVIDMAYAGIFMNIVAIVFLNIAVNSWGDAIFNFSEYPDIFRNETTYTIG